MPELNGKKLINLALVLVSVYFGVRYALPVAMPFLIGLILALAAEPGVRFATGRLHLPRHLSAGLGVSLCILILLGLFTVAGAIAVRQLLSMAGRLPDMTVQMGKLEDTLLTAADNAPEVIRPLAQRTVLRTFDSSETVVSQLAAKLPQWITALASGVGSSVLAAGTALLSAFLISARLPRLKTLLTEKMPPVWTEKIYPALGRFGKSLSLWLKAQLKLALITWGIVTVGFLLLQVSFAPVVGFLVALVDAIPILGTGTVLVPWAAVLFLQGRTAGGVGMLCIYAVALLTRTVLEPRLLGRHLGLDPLLTLVALYTGYRLWGIGGMLLMPILASAVKSVWFCE